MLNWLKALVSKLHRELTGDQLRSGSIGDMRQGDIRYYTVPWALWVDKQGRHWLNPEYPTTRWPHGTSEMRIERHKDGYHFIAPPGKTWVPQEQAPYGNVENISFIPVTPFKS